MPFKTTSLAFGVWGQLIVTGQVVFVTCVLFLLLGMLCFSPSTHEGNRIFSFFNCLSIRNYDFNGVHVEGARLIARLARESCVEKLIHFSALNASPTPQPIYSKEGSKFLRSKVTYCYSKAVAMFSHSKVTYHYLRAVCRFLHSSLRQRNTNTCSFTRSKVNIEVHQGSLYVLHSKITYHHNKAICMFLHCKVTYIALQVQLGRFYSV